MVDSVTSSCKLNVEVVYALAHDQQLIKLTVPSGTTVFDTVVRSKMAERFSDIDVEKVSLGIFGKVVKKPKEQLIQEGERVEIYRPLLIDPKQARANRAAKAAAKSKSTAS